MAGIDPSSLYSTLSYAGRILLIKSDLLLQSFEVRHLFSPNAAGTL
jgi:hypothetical protein